MTDYTPFWVFNGLAVTGDMEAMLALAAWPEVAEIRPNHAHHLPRPVKGAERPEVEGTEWNIAHIRTDAVWQGFGITGENIVVASMDSGVEGTFRTGVAPAAQ